MQRIRLLLGGGDYNYSTWTAAEQTAYDKGTQWRNDNIVTLVEQLDNTIILLGNVNTLLTNNGIAGLQGIQDLLKDVQPALSHFENFFAALEKGDYEDALTIAKTVLINDIDEFKKHPMGVKILGIVQPLANAAVDELVKKEWINSNAASQITGAVADLIDKDKPTKDTVIALVQKLTNTLKNNEIAAPTFENLSGTASTSFTLPSS